MAWRGRSGERREMATGLSRRGVLRRLGVAGAGVAVTTVATGRIGAQEASPVGTMGLPADFKVVLHAGQEQNWAYVASNLANLAREWPHAAIRVVVDGSAVYSLQGDNDLTAKLAEAAAAGVEFLVCTNALRDHAIDPTTIPAFAQVVVGGVVALVEAQRAGYAYVKP